MTTVAESIGIATPVVEDVGGILVVRDDLFPGGTKARILPGYLPPADEYVYASPAYGYAQIALAVASRQLGRRATIFTAKRNTPHVRTAEAAAAGAKVVMVPTGYLTNVQAKARAYCETSGAYLLAFGFDDEPFIVALAGVAAELSLSPRRVWCVAGSGVLCRALARAWPAAELLAVRVGCQPSLPASAQSYAAPERFEQLAEQPPPFASCDNYDAKAWRFIRQHGQRGDLFWNVAA